MADPTDVFDQWLKTWTLRPRFFPIPEGLAAPFKFVSHRTRTIIESFQSVFLPNRNIEIYADYIDDGEFNAAAGIHDNLGLIGLNTGAILRPIEVFYGMFSHPLALPNIGNSQAEKIGPQHSEGVPEDHVSLFKMRIEAGRSPWPTQPIDPIRLDTARLCIEMAWRFLIVHEITHILHGHVNIAKK
jgi:hypothetical protein